MAMAPPSYFSAPGFGGGGRRLPRGPPVVREPARSAPGRVGGGARLDRLRRARRGREPDPRAIGAGGTFRADAPISSFGRRSFRDVAILRRGGGKGGGVPSIVAARALRTPAGSEGRGDFALARCSRAGDGEGPCFGGDSRGETSEPEWPRPPSRPTHGGTETPSPGDRAVFRTLAAARRCWQKPPPPDPPRAGSPQPSRLGISNPGGAGPAPDARESRGGGRGGPRSGVRDEGSRANREGKGSPPSAREPQQGKCPSSDPGSAIASIRTVSAHAC